MYFTHEPIDDAFDGKDNSLDYKGVQDTKGEISRIIGSGQDAKNSIAYQVLKWSFVFLAIIFFGVSCHTIYNIYQKQL